VTQVSRISVVSDAEAARMVSAETLADLAERITASPYRQTPTARSRSRTWRLLIVIPVAAALAVALLIATFLFRPGEKVGPVPVGPPNARAAALSFARHGGHIDVIVRNPMASQARYRAEFAAHHMHITIKMIAASPSVVGTLVYQSANPRSGITIIRSRHACYTPGGGWGRCIVGVRVPAGYHGYAAFVFGRPARPGEQYQTAGSVTAPGEAMHGMRFAGRTVAAVLAMLHQRHVTAPVYRKDMGIPIRPGRVPRTWYAYAAVPWAPHQVLLFVGPARTPPQSAPPRHCRPAQPCPSPAPSAALS
jgi:hypothetical protein